MLIDIQTLHRQSNATNRRSRRGYRSFGRPSVKTDSLDVDAGRCCDHERSDSDTNGGSAFEVNATSTSHCEFHPLVHFYVYPFGPRLLFSTLRNTPAHLNDSTTAFLTKTWSEEAGRHGSCCTQETKAATLWSRSVGAPATDAAYSSSSGLTSSAHTPVYSFGTQTPDYRRDDGLYELETKARRGDREYGRFYEGADGRNSRGTHGHSLH